MINLIPNEEKKRKVKEFYFRFFVLFILILACSFLFASILLVPSYYASNLKKDFITEKLTMLEGMPLPEIDKENSLQVSILDNQLSLIEKAQRDKYVVSERVINEILLKKMPDIKIIGISYESNPASNEKSISIRGVAKSRERLLLFREALEQDILFKKVDLPISNFVKGSNISFNLNLIPS
jgi:hypothetical protein